MPSLMDGFKDYLLGRIDTEKKLLSEDGGVYVDGRRIYNVSRSVVAELALLYLDEILSYERSPQVLEIGGGEGNAIRALIESGRISPRNITMTSLTGLSAHKELKAKGVKVYTGVVVERLPKQWTNKFHLVMASAVLQWAESSEAVQEIYRVLKSGGLIVGFDARPTVASVEVAARDLGMTNVLESYDSSEWSERASGLVPFVLQK
ncbi:MAG TPA: methyltransferase domain-containing protein [Patescibacteria group bacterium]|nr:methyltransferase domain-containing protein [Patescibacteria group bacterium]